MAPKMSMCLVLLTAALLAACGLTAGPPAAPAGPDPGDAGAPRANRPAWEGKWETVLQEARKEGKVSIYTTIGADARQMLTSKFKERFGLELDFLSATGSEIGAKVKAERAAGLFTTDIFMSGVVTTINTLKPEGILDTIEDKLILPEVTDNRAWYSGKRLYADREQNHVLLQFSYPSLNLLVNSNKVKSGEVDSYRSLLEPKWKGKISIQDPTFAGAGETIFAAVGAVIINFDYWREFVKQDPFITRDRRLQVEWVAKEKHLITLGPSTPVVADFQRAGAPLSWLEPKEGTFLSTTQGLSLFTKRPHPSASQVFINWILTREMATEMSKTHLLQSTREDVPTDHLDPTGVRKPGVNYFIKDS